MKRLLPLFVYFFICNLTNAQNFDWVKSKPFNFSSNPANINSPLINSGNSLVYVYADSILQLFSSYAFGKQNVEISDLSGNPLHNFTLSPKCDVQKITCDANGNIFISGNYLDTLFLNGTDTLINTGTGFNTNAFIICIDQQAQLLWKRNLSLTVTSIEYVSALACDHQNNCWYAYSDFFTGIITKLDASGQDVTTLQLDGAKTIGGIDFDPNDNLFVAGAAESGPFTIGNLNYSVPTQYSFYVARYNATLQASWARFANDQTFHFPQIKADPFGNAYFCSPIMDSASFGNVFVDGPQWVYDFAAVKVDSSGEFHWGIGVPQQTPSITGDYNPGTNQFIDCDSKGRLFIGGEVRSTVDFGNGVVATKGSLNYNAISVISIDTSGNPMWCLSGGSNNYQHAASIAIDDNDAIYFIGTIRGNAQFGNISQINSGTTNFLLGKITANITSSIKENNSNKISIYPNPSSGVLQIHSTLQNNILNIYDLQGRKISSKEILSSGQINLQDLHAGMYFLEFVKDNQIQSFRWMKTQP
jgi:hypothetical protein